MPRESPTGKTFSAVERVCPVYTRVRLNNVAGGSEASEKPVIFDDGESELLMIRGPRCMRWRIWSRLQSLLLWRFWWHDERNDSSIATRFFITQPHTYSTSHGQMSGVEAAGFVLAAFPLLISALEHYRESAEVLKDWWRYKREYRKVKVWNISSFREPLNSR